MERNPFVKFILRRETILIAFVLSAIVSTITTDFSETGENRILQVLSLAVFPLLAWFTHKRALLATWCTVLLLIVTGSGFLYDGFRDIVKSEDPAVLFSLFRIVFGTYLTWGGLIIHRERHLRN